MVREIKAAPLLFGYRGSEVVDVDAVEELMLRVAQLKNDLPQVRSLELDAGARRRRRGDRAQRASARVEPVDRPALGLVRPPAAARSPGTRSPAERRAAA